MCCAQDVDVRVKKIRQLEWWKITRGSISGFIQPRNCCGWFFPLQSLLKFQKRFEMCLRFVIKLCLDDPVFYLQIHLKIDTKKKEGIKVKKHKKGHQNVEELN